MLVSNGALWIIITMVPAPVFAILELATTDKLPSNSAVGYLVSISYPVGGGCCSRMCVKLSLDSFHVAVKYLYSGHAQCLAGVCVCVLAGLWHITLDHLTLIGMKIFT